MNIKQAIVLLLEQKEGVCFNIITPETIAAEHPDLTTKQIKEVMKRIESERNENQEMQYHVDNVLDDN